MTVAWAARIAEMIELYGKDRNTAFSVNIFGQRGSCVERGEGKIRRDFRRYKARRHGRNERGAEK